MIAVDDGRGAYAVVEDYVDGQTSVAVEAFAHEKDTDHVELVATVDGREVAISFTRDQALGIAGDLEAAVAQITPAASPGD